MNPESGKIIYVARDIERALGILPSADYHIVTNRSSYSEAVKKQHPNFIHLVEPAKEGPLDTLESLEDPEVKRIIDDSKSTDADASILVFKNTPQIEAIAKNNSWKLLNPSAELAEKIENKLTQVEWLGELAEKYLPEHSIQPVKDLAWNKQPFIVQWAHGHTGDGTTLVNSQKELADLQAKFPDRPARKSAYLSGHSFTVNAVATDLKIVMGNPNYQITGLAPFTDNPFSTVGNDWSATHSFLTAAQIEYIETMVQDIGLKMQAPIGAGWRGFFGVDLMMDIERDRIFLIEINARQPASAVYESQLQERFRRHGIAGMTMFEAHLAALLGLAVDQTPVPINDGAQIVVRNRKEGGRRKEEEAQGTEIGELEKAGYMVIPYDNKEYNSDLLRIQSLKGIIGADGKLNKRGKEISKIIQHES